MADYIKHFNKITKINYHGYKTYDIVLIAAGLFLAIFLHWSVVGSILFAAFIAHIIKPFPVKYIEIFLLLVLLAVPFMLCTHRSDLAEQFSIYGFYSLVIITISAYFEDKRAQKKHV